MTAAELLAEAGRAMYGEVWFQRLADDLNISEVTLRRWRNGRVGLDLSHGVFPDLALALRLKAHSHIQIAEKIEAAMREAVTQ